MGGLGAAAILGLEDVSAWDGPAASLAGSGDMFSHFLVGLVQKYWR